MPWEQQNWKKWKELKIWQERVKWLTCQLWEIHHPRLFFALSARDLWTTWVTYELQYMVTHPVGMVRRSVRCSGHSFLIFEAEGLRRIMSGLELACDLSCFVKWEKMLPFYKLRGKYRDFLISFMPGLRNLWVRSLMYCTVHIIIYSTFILLLVSYIRAIAAEVPFILLSTFSPFNNLLFFPFISPLHIFFSPPFKLSNFFPSDLGIKGAHRLSGADLSAAHGLADEERWGLYYGVKALSKNDPEAQGNHNKCRGKRRRKEFIAFQLHWVWMSFQHSLQSALWKPRMMCTSLAANKEWMCNHELLFSVGLPARCRR